MRGVHLGRFYAAHPSAKANFRSLKEACERSDQLRYTAEHGDCVVDLVEEQAMSSIEAEECFVGWLGRQPGRKVRGNELASFYTAHPAAKASFGKVKDVCFSRRDLRRTQPETGGHPIIELVTGFRNARGGVEEAKGEAATAGAPSRKEIDEYTNSFVSALARFISSQPEQRLGVTELGEFYKMCAAHLKAAQMAVARAHIKEQGG